MNNAFYLSTAVIGVILVFSTYLAIWSRRPTSARLISLLTAVPAFTLCAGLAAINLGAPTYCAPGYTIPSGKLDVLGFKIIKDYRTYLLLDTPGTPTYCWVPYNSEQASALQKGKESRQGTTLDGKEGEGAARAFGFGHPEDPQPLTIHENPQEPNPLKQKEETQQFGE
jgi:hypothetical protein